MTADALAPVEDFPVLGRLVGGRPVNYLDSAATSLRPVPVLEAIHRYNTHIGANIHRGKHLLSDEASDLYEQARQDVAQFVGVRAAEVVFVRNTTEAINMVAAGLGLSSEDTIVVTTDAHHSNVLPWSTRGTVRFVAVDDAGHVDLSAFDAELRLQPRVVALTACSNVTGVYSPVHELCRRAKAKGATVVVDAAQSVPHRPTAFRQAGADYVAFSGHKMLAPTGVGVLCGTTAALEALQPTFLGGGTVDWVDLEGHRIRRIPHCFEYGTPDIAAVVGFGAAVRYLQAFGEDAAEHDRTMGRMLLELAQSRPYLRVAAQPASHDDRAGILSITVPGVPKLDDIARALSDSYAVMCRTGHLCAQPLVDRLVGSSVLRISTYVYTSEDDVARAFDALDEVVALLT